MANKAFGYIDLISKPASVMTVTRRMMFGQI